MDLEPKTQSIASYNKLTKESRESLKSFFHLLVGKPDSTLKIFPRPIQVNLQSLIDLDERVQDKLAAHHLGGMVASIDVAFDDNSTIEFGSLPDFAAHRWTSAKATREIRMRWQFLMSIQGYELPQQHALAIKLSSDAKPIEILQAMLSKHPGEDDNSIISMAPLVCRVDFISATVGQELIAVVGDWSNGLSSPMKPSKLMQNVVRRKKEIEAFICHATPVLMAFASVAYLNKFFLPSSYGEALSVGQGIGLMSWLMYSLVLIYVSQKIARALAKISMNALHKMGAYSIFALTNGDDKRRQALIRVNNRCVLRFVMSSGFSFVLNVASGVVTAVLWKGSN
jgi:hypothetical protein